MMTHSTRGNKWRVYLEIDGVLLTGEVVTMYQGRGAERHGSESLGLEQPQLQAGLDTFPTRKPDASGLG